MAASDFSSRPPALGFIHKRDFGKKKDLKHGFMLSHRLHVQIYFFHKSKHGFQNVTVSIFLFFSLVFVFISFRFIFFSCINTDFMCNWMLDDDRVDSTGSWIRPNNYHINTYDDKVTIRQIFLFLDILHIISALFVNLLDLLVIAFDIEDSAY